VPSYIKKAVGKVASIASAVTLGILSYTATPANAAEAPKKFEDPDLVRIVADSYSNLPEGKKRDENIVRLMLGACQDPGVSKADFTYMILNLSPLVSDLQKRKELKILTDYNLETGKKEAAAKAAYALALNNANKKKDKDRTKALISAAKTYYNALKKLEPAIEKTQYAQEMLKVAQGGLALAKQVPEILETKSFKDYVAEAKKAVEQAEGEEHLLSQIVEYDALIENALTNVEKAKSPAKKAYWYSEVKRQLEEAEKVFPNSTEFGSQIAQLEAKIKGLEKVPSPVEKPKSKPKKPPTPTGEKPPEKSLGPKGGKGSKFSGGGAASENKKSDKKDESGILEDIWKNFTSLFTGIDLRKQLGHRYDTRAEYRQGIAFEDKDGDNESLYFKFGDALEFALLREYLSGRNVADNLTSNQNLSGYLELSPVAFLGLDSEILKVGGMLENLGNKEWVYNETLLSDTPTETETKTANIRNFINREFGSLWIDTHIPNVVKARLAAMLDRTDLVTDEDSLTWHENHTDPSASYGVSGADRTSDRFSKQAVSALLGLPFEFLTDDALKGYFGFRMDHILEKEEFIGGPRKTEEILKLGLMTELYVNNDFGLAVAFLQDLNKEEGEDTKKAKTYRGQIAAALNLGTITDENDSPLFKALLFGHGWITGYEGDVFHGVGGGAVIGSDVVKDISGLVQLLFDKDSRKTGSRVELGDENWNEDTRIRSFLERKGFNNIPVGIIGGKNKYGFALISYGAAGKAIGIGGKTVTEKFAELSAVLDTPAIALIVSGYYADLALERQWGMRFRADVKRGLLRGLAGAIEFNQSRYLPTDELEREIAVALEIPFGADEDD